MSFTKRVCAALIVAATLLISTQSQAQVSTLLARPVLKYKYSQGPDVLVGLIPGYTYLSIFGDVSYNGQNMVYAGLKNGGSSIRVIDAANSVSTTTLIGSLGVLGNPSFIRVSISNTGRDVAASGITIPGVSHGFFVSGDSGMTWQPVSLPSVVGPVYTYDTLVFASGLSSGYGFGLGDREFQPSFFYGNDGKLYLYTYLEASGATSDSDRLALVEYVLTPGNLTPSTRVVFTVNSATNCGNRSCYINAVTTDTGILLIDGAGAGWNPGWPYPGRNAPRYAYIPYGSTGSTGSWGFVGDGSSSGVSLEAIDQDDIAISYMGVNAQSNQEFAFMRRKNGTAWGSSYAVSKLTLVNNAGVYSFPDTHPYPGPAYTSLNTSHLAAAGISSSDLAPLLGGGVGTRTVRDIAANRYTGTVSVFLFGPPDPQTGVMEIDDITSVRFAPGSSITTGMRTYVNDYKAAMATSVGLDLNTSIVGFDVVSRPDGRIVTFFTGSLVPNPWGSYWGKIFYQIW